MLQAAISTEIVMINGSTEHNRYNPVLQFEVWFDINAIADSFWDALGMEYEGNDRKWLLPPKVAKAFEEVGEALWHQTRPDLLDALESDFRVYLRIEDYLSTLGSKEAPDGAAQMMPQGIFPKGLANLPNAQGLAKPAWFIRVTSTGILCKADTSDHPRPLRLRRRHTLRPEFR